MSKNDYSVERMARGLGRFTARVRSAVRDAADPEAREKAGETGERLKRLKDDPATRREMMDELGAGLKSAAREMKKALARAARKVD